MDIELHLARSDARQTEVSVTCNGALSHTFDLRTLMPTSTPGLLHPIRDPVTYGKALYAALFAPDSPAEQALAAKPACILLVAADEELDALPWEYASDSGLGGWVACRCSFVRGLPTEQRSAPPAGLGRLHIVAVASSPLSHNLAPLNIQGEWTRLTEIVGGLDRAVMLERAWPSTIGRLRELVAGQQQRVVHFMGHGGQNTEGEAVLCFERTDGAREDVSAREFVQRVQGSVFLVTLNACQSATPGETIFGNLAKALVREQVPYALGMRFSIVDDDALTFSRDFYSDLARGVPVEEALLQARLTLAKSARAWACGNLVLYTSLTHAGPAYATELGQPDVRDAQEDALRGIIGVLPEVQGAFQGRIDEQIQLGTWLTGDRRPRIMTVHGNGGQGKTALARVTVERFAHAWPGGVWSMTLETVPTRAVFVTSLARFLGINVQDSAEPADLERQIQLRLRRQRTLLVLDNLETLDEAAKAQDAEALALIEFIQQLPGERTSLLCTSRHLLGWNGEQPLELPGLAPDDGAALFQQSAPNRIEEIDHSLARQLSQRVDGHPLGLSLLGRAFNDTHIALSAFLADHETYLLSAENTYINVNHRQRKMFANFAYSVRWLSPELRDTLSKLWVFHAPFLPVVAVAVLDAEVAEASPVEAHLHTLWQRGLLTREAIPLGDDDVYLYRLPPVMRPYIEQYLADERGREEILKRFGEASAGLAKNIYGALADGRAIATLALQCYDDLARGLSFVEGIAQGYYLLYWGWILHWLGDQHMGVTVTEQALEMAEGRDRALEGLAQNNLAMISRATGHPHEALRLYEQALAIRREVDDRAGEGATLNNLGGVYDDVGQKQQALTYFEQALAIHREVGNRAMEGTTLNNLGGVYNAMGHKQQALAYYEQALAIFQEVSDRAGEGTTLNNLGHVYDAMGQKQQALTYYEQALAIRREVGNRAGEGTTLHNIGMMYADSGQFDVALACALLAKALYEYVQSPYVDDEVQWIAALRLHLGEQQFASLFAQVEHRADEIVERALQEKDLSDEDEQITFIVDKTITVMTTMQERRDEWREDITQALQDVQQRGTDWQIEVEFFTAVLAILDGQPPSLAADHPYAPAIAAIEDGIARGGPEPDDGDDVPEEEAQALAVFVQASIAALRSPDPQEKMAFMQQLVPLQAQAPDDEMQALFQAIQLALLGGDLAHLGDHLTSLAREMWDAIVAGVQQDDTPSGEAPDTV
ncbi:MAG: tetratricopeptide repeat protein [Ktedonobacteraceae bacterium]|nr:tetratricopeptide repeat protein [Ktedonobacteraceae bacterium]